jgi:hypothetical protein
MTNTNEARQQDDAAPTAANTSTRPVMSFSGSGGIHVAIWKNKSESGIENYSIRVERNYKDSADGAFKSTPYLRDSDLPRAEKLLSQADAWIEQDKQKQRASGAGRA